MVYGFMRVGGRQEQVRYGCTVKWSDSTAAVVEMHNGDTMTIGANVHFDIVDDFHWVN